MTPQIAFEVVGQNELAVKFQRFPPTLRKIIASKFATRGDLLVRAARAILRRPQGPLGRSIKAEVNDTPTGNELVVGSAGLAYAAIQERGGVTPPHVIKAKRAQALMFSMGGNVLFRRSVNHPGSRITGQGYLRHPLADQTPAIMQDIRDAATEADKVT